ncbi:MAG: hypothetical protein N2C12_13795, partial [Planctomycetales bacterium]
QGRTLTGNVSAAMVRYGVDHYLLPKRAAKQILSEGVQRANVQYVSPEVARDIIRDQLAQLSDEQDPIGPDVRADLVQQGRQLGLQQYEIDAIIRQGLGQECVSKWQFASLLGAGLVVGLGVIAFFVWLFFLRPTLAERLEKEVPGKKDPTTVAQQQSSDLQQNPETRLWWENHDDLRLAVMSADRSFSWFKSLQEELLADDITRRRKAYKQLIGHHAEASVDKNHRQLFRRLITQFVAHEPDDGLVVELANLVHGRLPARDARLAKDVSDYDESYRVVELSVVVAQSEDLSDPRQVMWHNSATEALEISIDQDLPAKEVLKSCRRALAERIYQALIASAKDDPDRCFLAFQKIERPVFRTHLDKATRESLVTQYLVVVLPVAGKDWDKYRVLINESIFSPEPTNALVLVDILESISDQGLQQEVAGLLLTKVNAEGATSLTEVVQVVREGLGVRMSKSKGSRWNQFEKLAETTLSSKQSANVTDLLRLSALGAALSKAEFGAEQFDKIWDRPPVKLTVPVPPLRAVSKLKPQPLRSEIRKLGVLIRRMENPEKIRSASDRTEKLRSIVGLISKVSKLEYDQARVLADYILVYKRNEEDHDSVIRWVKDLGKWQGVKLAMVDRFRESSKFNINQVEDVLRALLGRGMKYDMNTESHRRDVRIELFQSVVDSISSGERDSPDSAYLDDVEADFFEKYQQQARLLGVSETARNSAATPHDLLEVLITQKARELNGRSLSSEAEAQVRQVKAQLKITD